VSARACISSILAIRFAGCLLCVVAALSLIAGLAGCVFGDIVNKQLVGPYRLFALDHKEELSVVYDCGDGLLLGRIDNVIIDIGWNERFVVASRRPESNPGGALTYYYIDIAKDGPGGPPEGAVVGPLSKEQFDAAKAALDLPDFTLHYPESISAFVCPWAARSTTLARKTSR
jgi:hypothetical protein